MALKAAEEQSACKLEGLHLYIENPETVGARLVHFNGHLGSNMASLKSVIHNTSPSTLNIIFASRAATIRIKDLEDQINLATTNT